jgi:hypothetical protein
MENMLGPRDLPRVSADARVAASVTLVAVVICASATFALTPRAGAVSAPSGNRLAQASPSPVVKIVNATPRSERCEEQTWPYFDRRCLPGTTQSPQATGAPATVTALPMAAPSSAAVQPIPAAQPAKPSSSSPPTARQVTGGSQLASASAPQTSATASASATTGIAPRDELSPVMRADREDIRRRDELIAAWEAEETARRAEEERPPEPRRRKVRRHHHQFGFFGFGLRF